MSVEIVREDGMARILLARPRANVLDAAMMRAIGDALDALAPDARLRLLVFEGAGSEFSYGASVEEHQAERVREMLTGFHALFRRIEALGVPTAAAVRGRCLGGGLELAAWTGRVVATADAQLACPEVKLGVFAPMGTLALTWRMRGGAALDLLLSGRVVTGAEARVLGLVDEVADDPTVALRAWYQEHLAPKSAVAVRHAWRAARLHRRRQLEEDLPRLEAMYLDELMSTHDANEGIRAFLDKRPPVFEHR